MSETMEMTGQENKKERLSVLELSFEMGKLLLENGAEVFRVQETMERVARAFQVEDFNAYVLTNAIFVNGTEEGVQKRTEIKNIPNASYHFGRVCAVNQLSREIARGKYTVEEARDRLEEIKALSFSPLPLAVLSCAFGSAAFSFLFGGCGWDSLAAFFCGILLELFLYLAGKKNLSKFLTNLCASALVALVASCLWLLGLGSNLDKVIIGSIVRLVPGIVLTSGIRDLFHGDYLSGAIRMMDAVLVGGCIAVGVGVVISLLSPVLGGALV